MALEGQIMNLEKKIRDLEGENQRLKNRLEASERDSEEANSKIKELRALKNQISEYELSIEEYRLKLERANKLPQIDPAVLSELDQVKEKLRIANNRISDLENELKSKKVVNTNLQDRLAEIEELKNTDAILRGQLRNLREELENTTRECEKHKIIASGLETQLKELNSLTGVIRDKNNEISELDQQIRELQQANKEFKRRNLELESLVNPPKPQFLDRQNELLREIDGLRNIIRIKEDQVKKLDFEVADLQEMKKRVDNFEEELAACKRQLEKVTVQRDRAKMENETLKKSLEDTNLLKFKLDELLYKVNTLENEVEVKGKKMAFYENENATLNGRLKALKKFGEDNNDAKSQVILAEDEIARQRRALDERDSQIEMLSSQLRQIRDRSELTAQERDKIRRLEIELASKNNEIDQLISNMRNLQLGFDDLKRDMDDSPNVERLRDELSRSLKNQQILEASSANKIKLLEDDLLNLKKRYAVLEEQKLLAENQFAHEIDHLSTKLMDLERNKDKIENYKNKDSMVFEDQLNDYKRRLSKYENQKNGEVGELRQRILELQKQLSDSNHEGERARMRLIDVEAANRELQYQNENYKIRLDSWRNGDDGEVGKLQRMIDDYVKTIDRKNREIADLSQEKSALKNHLLMSGDPMRAGIGSSDDAGDTLKSDNQKLATRIVNLTAEKEDLWAEVGLLKEKLSQKDEFIQRSKLGSHFGDSNTDGRRNQDNPTSKRVNYLSGTGVRQVVKEGEQTVGGHENGEREPHPDN
jgi:chromosome segregation ATPase